MKIEGPMKENIEKASIEASDSIGFGMDTVLSLSIDEVLKIQELLTESHLSQDLQKTLMSKANALTSPVEP